MFKIDSIRQRSWLLICFVTTLSCVETVSAYTPKSPEVVRMVKKAAIFLADNESSLLGGDCLIGLTLLKVEGEEKHKKQIAAIVQRCKKACDEGISHGKFSNYDLGIAIIFLCEFGPDRYRSCIEQMIDEMLARQLKNGAWTYYQVERGDTSQTQYAVLCLWTADSIGIDVPYEPMGRVLQWLVRTQDVSGGWGYHANDPGPNKARLKQSDVSKSLSAAGLGSLYIGANMLGRQGSPGENEQTSGLPPGLKPAGKSAKKNRRGRGRASYNPASLLRAINDGNKWLENNYAINQVPWGHYYRYALERYASFRELADNEDDPEPSWYNDGVEFLMKIQSSDGSFRVDAGIKLPPATAFAVLFLIRSTKLMLEKNVPGKGILRGGRSLPKDTSIVRMVDGRVIGPTIARSMAEVLAILESSDSSELNQLLYFSDQDTLDTKQEFLDEDVARLRQLVSGESYQIRLIAVQTLVKSKKLEIAPVLIYALSDPDFRVALEARNGLRFISRKFNGFGMPDSKPTKEQLKKVQHGWKTWYLSLYPDALFLD